MENEIKEEFSKVKSDVSVILYETNLKISKMKKKLNLVIFINSVLIIVFLFLVYLFEFRLKKNSFKEFYQNNSYKRQK